MVKSPVAASESRLPSVRRQALEHAIFPDPPLYPNIVFYRMVSMFLPFFGHFHSDGFPTGQARLQLRQSHPAPICFVPPKIP